MTEPDRQLMDKVQAAGQGHILKYIDELNDLSRKKLMSQIHSFDFEQIKRFKTEYLNDIGKAAAPLSMKPAPFIPIPCTDDQKAQAETAFRLGESLIRQGKLGVVLVAGGQGTRLEYDGPKGSYPIGPVTSKSIFQLHAEKILAASRRYSVSIPWYIMTSAANEFDTKAFFEDNNSFGLNSGDVFFFTQRMLPALTPDGKMILDAKDHVFTSPNGHGGTLPALAESGAIADMKQRGVEILSYFQVDNVMIRIIDPVFIGYHMQENADMSSKMLEKRSPYEKLGHFGLINGKMNVIEYSDMSKEDLLARETDGNLKYKAGSIAIHVINVNFVEQEITNGFKLSYHVAHKRISYLNEQGELTCPDRPNGYKFETFIFDALRDTDHSIIMEIEREKEFSPVKNKEGEDSPATARQDLTNYYGEWIEAAGVPLPRDASGNVQGAIEISPLFADTKEMCVARLPRGIEFDGSLYVGPE